MGYKCSDVGYISIYSNKDFSSLKNDLFDLQLAQNSAKNWNVLMRFSAKRFALVALSVYNNYTEIVRTLSFDH